MSLIVISHRANLYGPISGKENHPDYIDAAIDAGFQVEVDVRFIDKKWYLGHDGADYKVSFSWMMERNQCIFWHCKNLEALIQLNRLDRPRFSNSEHQKIFYFWHQNDDYTLTSGDHIWTFPNKPIKGKRSILCLNKKDAEVPKGIYGICTDYPLDYKSR